MRGTTEYGANDSGCHLDLPMFGCTLTLDDEPMVVGGVLAEDLVSA